MIAGGVSISSRTRRPAVAGFVQLLRCTRQRDDALERCEREQGHRCDEHAIEITSGVRRHRRSEDADRRQPGDEHEQPRAESRDERVATCVARECAIGGPYSVQAVVVATVEHELGCSPEKLDQIARQLPARGRVPPSRRTGESAREQRHADAGDGQSDREDRTGERKDQCGRGDGDSCHRDRSGRRPDAPQVEALKRVDVADHSADEISATEALELRGRERLDALVEPGADVAERAQCQIVRDEAVEVAGEWPGEPEEANEDDRHGQREDRRLLRRPGDQVARGGDQAHAQEHGQRRKHDRERNA